ncbi:tetratricopeptide repeat protein [bacterium]|nr:tetratricopeptide repeat protein [bacterium]
MKKIITLFLILVLFSCNNNREHKEDYYIIGVSFLKNKRYTEALKAFETDYSENGNIQSLYKLVDLFIETGDIFNTEHYLKKILELNKDDSFGNFKLGLFYKRQGKYDAAISYLTKTITDKTYQKDSYYHLIVMFLNISEEKQALNLYKESLSLFDRYDSIEYFLFKYFYSKKNEFYKNNLDWLLEHSSNYTFLNGIVDTFLKDGVIEEAIETLQTLEKKFPSSIDTLLTLGQIYQKKGEHERALEYFTKAEQQDKNSFFVKLSFLTEYIYFGEYKRAEKYLVAAIGIKIESLEALMLGALLYHLKGESNKSDKLWETVIKNLRKGETVPYKDNPLISYYILVKNMEEYPLSKDEVLQLDHGVNSQLVAIKMEFLNNSGFYIDSLNLYEVNKDWLLGEDIYKQLFISYLFLGKKDEAKNSISKIEKNREIYQLWYDYSIDRKCNIPKNIDNFKDNPIFVDIYSDCLVIQKKYLEAKDFLIKYIQKESLNKETLEYIKNKILKINFHILKE